MNSRDQKHFISDLAINHICQSKTGLIESVAEVVSACHICLMRRLIVPLLDSARSISNNEQLLHINIWTLKRAVWPPGSLFAQGALYFDQLEGNPVTGPDFKQHFCGRASTAPPLCVVSQMDFGINTTFCLFIPVHCTRLLLCLSGVLFWCASLLPMPLSSTVF